MKKYRGHAFAQSTAATYKSQLRAYFRFCLYFGYRPVPGSSHHLLGYVVFLAWALAASNIPCYLIVVRTLHLQCGFPNPLQEPLSKFQKDLLMWGIKRLHGDVVHKSFQLHRIFYINSMESLTSLTPWMRPLELPVSSPSSHSFGNLIYLTCPRARLTLTNTLRMCDIRVCT